MTTQRGSAWTTQAADLHDESLWKPQVHTTRTKVNRLYGPHLPPAPFVRHDWLRPTVHNTVVGRIY